MKRSTVVVVSIVMLVGGARLEAQVWSEGARVRVTTSTARFKGTLTAIRADSFKVAPERGGLLTVPRDSVERLEVSLGMRRNLKKGLLIGALAGAALGGLTCTGWCEDSRDAVTVVFAGASALGQMGAIIGHFTKSERLGGSRSWRANHAQLPETRHRRPASGGVVRLTMQLFTTDHRTP